MTIHGKDYKYERLSCPHSSVWMDISWGCISIMGISLQITFEISIIPLTFGWARLVIGLTKWPAVYEDGW